MKNTKIEWAHHTFNAWIGCSHVSEGCENCYAEAMAHRAPHLVYGQHGVKGLPVWGDDAPRRKTGADYWKNPVRWNAAAAQAGVRERVFVNSMSDVFEEWLGDVRDGDSLKLLNDVRTQLWRLIEQCPALDFLLLTKRPENIPRLAPLRWMQGGWPAHVWIGCTAENQDRAEQRIPHLLQVPAAVRFISYEPALGPIDFDRGRCDTHDRRFVVTDPTEGGEYCNECAANGYSGELSYGHWLDACASPTQPGINWIIVGGESGSKRPFDAQWARDTVRKGRDVGVPVFVKQMGSFCVDSLALQSLEHGWHGVGTAAHQPPRILLKDAKKGGDIEEWPEDLRVRQLPEVAA